MARRKEKREEKREQQAYNQSQQGYDQNQQTYGQNQQGYDQSQQNYSQGQQMYYGQGQQGYSQNQQSYGQGQQGYSQNQQGYAQGQQNYSQGQQMYGQNQQGYDQSQQNYGQGQQMYYGQGQQNYSQGQQMYGQNQQGYGQNQQYGGYNYNYGQPQGGAYYNGQPQPAGEGTGKKKKKRKKRKVVLFIVEVIILLLLAAALYVAAQISKLSGISKVNTAEQSELKEQISAQLSDDVEETLSNYWNIALYGVDSRDESTQGLSDTIMICSINRDTKDVKLVSVYRDTYLDNTSGSLQKATECYLVGGAAKSMNMLNKNLDLDIVNYVTVNMQIVTEVVDAVGGVEIEITEDEATWINNYQNETSEIVGQEKEEVYGAGVHLLNGLQATSYCRIRAVGNNDYERTERQRKVVSKVLEKVQSNPTLLVSIVNSVYDNVSTNLTKTEILDLAMDVASYTLVDNTGFPFEKEAVQMSSSVVASVDIVAPVNLTQNVTELHQWLFGNDGYTPSSTVQEISDWISSETGVY